MIENKVVSAILYVLGGGIALFLAYLNGKKAERIHHLKEEAAKTQQEQETKNEVENNVNNMSDSDIRDRLQHTKSK